MAEKPTDDMTKAFSEWKESLQRIIDEVNQRWGRPIPGDTGVTWSLVESTFYHGWQLGQASEKDTKRR
jgi:hypothetical protein